MGLLTNDNNLTIETYKTNSFGTSDKIDSKTLAFNPTELKLKWENDYIANRSIGVSPSPTYRGPKPESLTLPLMFDNTLNSASAITAVMGLIGSVDTITKQVNDFKEFVFTVNGDIHQANFVLVSYGDFIYKGQTKCVNVAYQNFTSDGEPLRAKVDLTISGSLDLDLKKSEAGLSSPDLTHTWLVKEGDSLAGIAYDIYGDSRYYRELAKVNRLNSFRTLEPGTRIIVPPLEK